MAEKGEKAAKVRIEDEVADVIAHAREATGPHAPTATSNAQLERRIVEIEASLLALSSHLDEAFAEIEKLK
jgi:hypothetical protein